MLISRHPLTGAEVNARRVQTKSKDVLIDAQSAGASAMVWLTAAQALAVAAYSLGIDEDDITAYLDHPDPNIAVDEMHGLITGHLAAAHATKTGA